jgi:hypothetical protein
MTAMPAASVCVDAHTSGATTAVAMALPEVWTKLWQEAARPRWFGNKSNAIKVRLGIASADPAK